MLIVDDSAFMRRVAAQIIESSGEFVVAGTARNGVDGLEQVRKLDPDIVTLDVDMPEMDGLTALHHIMSEAPRPVVMLSAGTTTGGQEATLRALELGAVDFVLKPSGSISLDLVVIADRLLGALRGAVTATIGGEQPVLTSGAPIYRPAHRTAPPATHCVVIAASTGGPRALAAVMPRVPGSLGAAVLIVQHMPAGFTKSLAHRLDRVSPLPVSEAVAGEPVVRGRAYIAPGGFHMSVIRDGNGPIIALDQTPPIWGVRPAADILFKSAASIFGAGTLAVVLTGMGRDGAAGTLAVRQAGGLALIQDRETATIFGMPHAALEHAGADRIVALADVGSAIAELVDAVRNVP